MYSCGDGDLVINFGNADTENGRQYNVLARYITKFCGEKGVDPDDYIKYLVQQDILLYSNPLTEKDAKLFKATVNEMRCIAQGDPCTMRGPSNKKVEDD